MFYYILYYNYKLKKYEYHRQKKYVTHIKHTNFLQKSKYVSFILNITFLICCLNDIDNYNLK